MNLVENILPQKILESKLALLETALTNKQRWYTGVSLKTFLQNSLFDLFNDQNKPNLALVSDRWSAYCQYSNIASFINLLDKHEINSDSNILVHPLLPAEFLDILMSRGVQIVECDISLDTLTFDNTKFEQCVTNSDIELDLIIHYIDSGLYSNVHKLLNLSAKHSIPSLVYANSHTVTPDFLDMIQAHTTGSIMWNYGECFEDNMIDKVVDQPLATNIWTFSWFMETRMKSSPEYHLSQSQDCYEPVIESYYSLLLSKYKKLGIKTLLYSFKHKIARTMKRVDPDKNQKIIKKSYPEILIASVPDIVFELQNNFPNESLYPTFYQISDVVNQIQLKCKSLRSAIITFSKTNTSIENDIPDYLEGSTYLKYFFYTKDKQFWADWAYKQNIKIYEQQPLHTIFTKSNLPNASKIANEIVYFDTIDILTQS